jgi:hypothetical protein
VLLLLLLWLLMAQVSMGYYSPGQVFTDRTARLETTLADMNSALASLRYQPDPDFNGFDELVITVWDNGNSANVPNYGLMDGGTFSVNVTKLTTVTPSIDHRLQVDPNELPLYLRGDSNVITNFIHINVLPENDQPYVRMFVPLQSVEEDVDLLVEGIRIDDVDAYEYRNNDRIMEVIVTAVFGTVRFPVVNGLTVYTSARSNNRGQGEYPGPGVGGNTVGTRVITALGTLNNINAALENLLFRSDANFNGRANVTVWINDRGCTGAPYPMNDTNTVQIDVLPVNDPPVVHVPTKSYRVFEDMDAVLVAKITDDDTRVGVGVQVGLLADGVTDGRIYGARPGENSTWVNVSIIAAYGHITLPLRGPNVTYLAGDGYQDRALTITGTIQDVNHALSRIVYRSQLNWNSVHSVNGFDVVTLQADDTGLLLPLTNYLDYDLFRVRPVARTTSHGFPTLSA